MTFQDFLVNPGFVVKPINLCNGGQFAEIPVAFFIFGQQNDMRKPFIVLNGFFGNGARCDVAFTPDNRFYAGFKGLFIKIDSPEHGSVIGNGHTVHAISFNPLQERLYANGAVQKAVLGVNVEMYKISHCILGKQAIGYGPWVES